MDTPSYYRTRIGLVAPEDRVRSLRTRRLHTYPEPMQQQLPPRPEGRRRWTVASWVGLVLARRSPRKPTTSLG